MNRRPEHLTEREEEILHCIRRWIEDKGEGPSMRQLAHAVGMRSTASAAYHLANLERSGALIRDGRGWNTCRLGHQPAPQGLNCLRSAVSCCGRACGRPKPKGAGQLR
ncbi:MULTISPECIES: hypothetical protein [unclassified Streptomyces]|uniref:LexA family protein n=1 Tax=unclassified Streptomyces TaxID=2593676 RepID=UPI00343B5C6C